ncbi:MAG: thiamine-phosphate synthase family protein, partial [Promethearchaeota archaeon]
ICSKYLDINTFEGERERIEILEKLVKAFDQLRYNTRFVSVIPEVQSNLILGLSNPDLNSPNDYAAFPGRIIKHENEARITASPAFGASKHVAKIVSIVRCHFKRIRSSACIAYNEKIENALKDAGLKVLYLENERDLKSLDDALESHRKENIDAIIFKGVVGMEPLTYILGQDLDFVMDKLEKVLAML